MPVAFKPVFTTVSRALLAALHRARSRMSLPSAGTCQSPAALASSAALGFLSPADFLHEAQRWDLRFASGFLPLLNQLKLLRRCCCF